MTWRGIYAIAVTPFTAAGELDRGGLRDVAEFLARSPVDVIVVLGSEGEFYALTDEERRAVVEAVTETVQGRKPVVAGVSHPSAREAAALARHAAAAGCDAVMTTAPYYVKADEQGLRAHVESVAACGRPVVFYNVPARVGYDVSVDTMLQLAGSVGISVVKQASPDLSALADLVERGEAIGLTVVGGAEVAVWPALAIGAHGNTATAASAIPEVFAELWQCAVEGDFARGKALYARLGPLRRAYQLAGGQAAVVKRLMELRGLPGGSPRPPLRPVGPEIEALLRDQLARLELAVAR
jgi:4-hydroxy-tetrahydrodipicolinate synthase